MYYDDVYTKKSIYDNKFLLKLNREAVSPMRGTYLFTQLMQKLSKDQFHLYIYPMSSIHTLPKITTQTKTSKIFIGGTTKIIVHVSKRWMNCLSEKEMVDFALMKMEGKIRVKYM